MLHQLSIMSISDTDDQEEPGHDNKNGNGGTTNSDVSDDFVNEAQDTKVHKSASKKTVRPKKDKNGGGKQTYPDNLLLTDGDSRWFYVYDDPEMKRWLGSETFCLRLRFHPNGFVDEGGDKGNLRIYKSSMMQVRHLVKCLYTEPEYEQLAIEAHVYSRPKEKGKSGSGRAPFICVHCQQSCKDKNRLSWHRITGECPPALGGKFLKMYPTWEQSQTDELQRIVLNNGLSLSVLGFPK